MRGNYRLLRRSCCDLRRTTSVWCCGLCAGRYWRSRALAMFATRDTFFDDDTDAAAGEPEQAELENAVIMPMPAPAGGPGGVEPLLPGDGGGPPGGAWDMGEDEALMPGSGAAPAAAP
eukprot:COSAG06_NODE_22657_length_716_cov_2.051864_1_plen_118_part_00